MASSTNINEENISNIEDEEEKHFQKIIGAFVYYR
jgi:hypothetical protein